MIVDLTIFGAGIFLQTTFDDFGFGVGEPLCVAGRVGEDEVNGAADEDGGDTFEVEASSDQS